MNANILIYTLLLSFLVTQVSYAQRTFSTDPEREIIVQFTDDVLAHKNEATSGRLSDYTFTSNRLKLNLDSVGVETISKLFAEFKKEDRFVETINGKQVTLSDWSNTLILHLPANSSREKFIERLNQLPEVVYAEANIQGSSEVIYDFRDQYHSENEGKVFMPVTPNDPNFNRQWALKNTGTSIQGSGTPDADIDADLAWDISTGNSSVKIAIIDGGVDNNHPEFAGKITGYSASYSSHGTAVAGIAAAKGNNSAGIAGVAYDASIIDGYAGNKSAAEYASAIVEVSQEGAHILNASWGLPDYSVTVRKSIRDAYLLNQVFVTSAGNSTSNKYPQHIRDGVISVGSTTNQDVKTSSSSTGSWIDVAAPGGGGSDEEDDIYSPLPGGTYGYTYNEDFQLKRIAGTSMAAPVVSGIAALLLDVNPNLYNDDIENLIEISAEDINNNGFDNSFGHGRVNAYDALKLLQSPYVMNYGSITGGSIYSQSGGFPMRTYDVSGLTSGLQYYVKRVEVRKNISFSYMDDPNVWCRGVESVGWTKEENHGGAKRNYGQGFCEVVPGTITNTGATLRTYIYHVWNYSLLGGQGSYIGIFPVNENYVDFAYTVHGIPGSAPFSAGIMGLWLFNPGETGFWGANASGGTSPYSFSWYRSYSSSSGPWSYVGSGSSYSQTVNQQMWLKLNGSDSGSQSDQDIMQINITNCTSPPCPKPKIAGGTDGPELPEQFKLEQNYPNPFNPSTQITYALPEAAQVTLKVYNIMGQQVATLVNTDMSAGFHEISFDAGTLSSGMYIARMEAIGESGIRFDRELKMQLIK